MEMMDMAADDTREELRRKLRNNFDGRIVRKDLTKKIKEGANVPVYVLEFLLGQYCSSDDETIIEQGVQNVKRILADNFVRPDEACLLYTSMKNFQHYCENRITEIERLEPKYENYAYPGKELLEKGKKRLSALVQIQAPLEFFKTVFDEQDDLMDFGEDYEPIRDFFGSEQLTIFTRVLDMLNIYEDSKTYIVDAELEDMVAKMRTIVRMPKPYKEIQMCIRDRSSTPTLSILIWPSVSSAATNRRSKSQL